MIFYIHHGVLSTPEVLGAEGNNLVRVCFAVDDAAALRICDLLNRNGMVDVPLTLDEQASA